MPRKAVTFELFVERSKKIHNNKYSYNNSNYINTKNKIDINCPIHGIFHQLPEKHLAGKGCPKCNPSNKLSSDDFINRAIKIHGDLYSYDNVSYTNTTTKVKIFCKKHSGHFEQMPREHLAGKGCQICNGGCLYTKDTYIKLAIQVHGNSYCYNNIVYVNQKTKISILCNKCNNYFNMLPSKHLIGQGCVCNKLSFGVRTIIKYLEDNNILYKREVTFDGCVYKKKLRFDFYIKSHNLCIEFDGLQHFQEIEFFGIKSFKNTQIRDEIKNKYCIDNNINLLRIAYNENVIEKLKRYFKIV